jgi:hypothetical protein
MFENRVLKRLFGPKSEEDGSWRKLRNNDELHSLYSSPNTVRVIESMRMRRAGHVARRGGKRIYRFLFGKPEGKRPLGRPRKIGIDGASGFRWFRIEFSGGLL